MRFSWYSRSCSACSFSRFMRSSWYLRSRAADSSSRFSRLRSLKKLWMDEIRNTMLNTSQVAISAVIRIVCKVVTVIIAPPSIQEVFIVIAGEVRLCTCLAAERLTVTDLLQVVEPAGDSLVAGAVEGVKGDAGTAIHTGVHLGTVEDRVQVCIHDAGSRGGIGIHEVGVLVGLVIRTFSVAVTKRSFQNRERRYRLAVALELSFALLVGSFDGGLDLGDGLGIGLRDDKAHAVLGSAAVDGFRLPDICIAPAGVDTGDNLHGIADFYILTHCCFPP